MASIKRTSLKEWIERPLWYRATQSIAFLMLLSGIALYVMSGAKNDGMRCPADFVSLHGHGTLFCIGRVPFWTVIALVVSSIVLLLFTIVSIAPIWKTQR